MELTMKLQNQPLSRLYCNVNHRSIKAKFLGHQFHPRESKFFRLWETLEIACRPFSVSVSASKPMDRYKCNERGQEMNMVSMILVKERNRSFVLLNWIGNPCYIWRDVLSPFFSAPNLEGNSETIYIQLY